MQSINLIITIHSIFLIVNVFPCVMNLLLFKSEVRFIITGVKPCCLLTLEVKMYRTFSETSNEFIHPGSFAIVAIATVLTMLASMQQKYHMQRTTMLHQD